MTGELIIPHDAPSDLTRAAGGVVIRRTASGDVEVACIYREARGDWTFPKGKLDEGETFEQGALREVEEEINHRCAIARFIGATNYTHRKGRPKIVAYYLMTVISGNFVSNSEVDELVWLPLGEVREHLTWERDQELFDLVVVMPEVQPLAS